MKNLPLLCLFVLFASLLEAQYLENPSFEGDPTQNQAPPGWQPCDAASSPDTQPGAFGVQLSPADGSSYLGLVSRGSGGPFPNRSEDVSTPLLSPLKPGVRYQLKVQLAFSPEFGQELPWSGQFQVYDHPLILEVWGGQNPCERARLLWQSPPIPHNYWQTYEVTLESSTLVNTLTLGATWPASDSASFGNILIDDLVLIEAPASLMLPNVFTPNDDGIQDLFCPFALEGVDNYSLRLYDRWGQEVFYTQDPTQGWDGQHKGETCNEGVYFWAVEYSSEKGETQRQFGNVTLLR